jgi:hypothetical protein
MAASGAIKAFGTILQLGESTSFTATTNLAEVISIGGPTINREMIDVTHLSSDDMTREFIGGVTDYGEVPIEISYIPANATHIDLLTNIGQTTVSSVFRDWRIVWPDGTHVATSSKLSFKAAVSGFTPGVAVENQLTGTVTFKVSGKAT